MNNMVTNFTSTVSSQSPSTPAKNANNDTVVIRQDGNQAVRPEPQRQSDAAEKVSDNLEQRLDDVVERLNDFVQQTQRDLNFRVDKESGQTVVTVTDAVTEEVIRQIPSQEALERLQYLEDLQGLLFRDKA